MVFRVGEPLSVWRTRGGIYTESLGRVGKSTSLRVSPYGIDLVGPELVACFAAVRTLYGRRYRSIGAAEVRSGMQLYLESLRGQNLTISDIQDTYSGTRVAEITSGEPHVVTTQTHAWFLRDGNRDHAIPLLTEGWTGAPEVLPDIVPSFILRVETSSITSESHNDGVEMNAPGWAPLLGAMAESLNLESADIRIMNLAFEIDGTLAVRLANVPLLDDGRPAESIERIVRQAIAKTRRTCLICGSVATSYGEPDQVPFVQRVVCPDHKTETETADPPARTAMGLPLHLRNYRVQIDPGWYPLIVELDEELSRISAYTLQSCTQALGRLKFVTSFPEQPQGDKARSIRETLSKATGQSATTCEHCNREGTRRSEPWIHVCCPACDTAGVFHRPLSDGHN